MTQNRDPFEDEFEKSLVDAASMSDDELARLLDAPAAAPGGRPDSFESLEAGDRVEGTVVEVRGGEVLVELDGKTLGVVDAEEYDGEPPRPGTRVQAEFVRRDAARDLFVLSTRPVRTEVAWEELRVGMTLEGTVVETNKGGLTLDIRGMRAFMPISCIERQRVEDIEPYVGRKLRFEVTQVDRAERNLVVSRRAILDREAEAQRGEALEKLSRGDVVRGRVTQLNQHGAFIDLGGVEGLLHASKIAREMHGAGESGREALEVGDLVEVEIVSIDRERGRVGLDFREIEENAWETLIEGYAVGDEVTGWISRVGDDGAVLSLEEGLEAIVPRQQVTSEMTTGTIVTATITEIDRERQRIAARVK